MFVIIDQFLMFIPAQTYLHVIESVSLTEITRSPLEPSSVGGVIDKPITRPVGTNRAAALDSCYMGQSGPKAFDRGLLLLVGHQVSKTH